jgi:mannose-1-phosphate guanylyltransferase/mannose-6-phosphate isomerase|tara:strand:+ start:355 stop:1806 length:1452 start_codon:yes stop_codon:yes gene_type:complete
MELIPVVLAGGVGSRLWPVSREMHPKPFMKMEDGESLLQKTFLRSVALPSVKEVMTVTNHNLFFKTQDDYLSVNTSNMPTSFVLESEGRNTAPAIAIAALQISKKYGNDAVMLVLSADHLIQDQQSFQDATSKAIILAEQGYLVTFGIEPKYPETGYGYIESDTTNATFSADKSCRLVKRFVEKPNIEKAKEYCAMNNYFWNSGIFCFKASTILTELNEHASDILKIAKTCLESSDAGDDSMDLIRLDNDTFSEMPDISIDYAVMEKSNNVAVVSCDIGWSDIGSWAAISGLGEEDESGNVYEGEPVLIDVANSYIHESNRTIGLLGVKDLIIVDTPDALLIANKGRSQDVKQIVNKLKTNGNGKNNHLSQLEVHRPWGVYTVLEDSKHHKIKRIEVKSGASISLQLHHHRNEHWIVVSGTAEVINNGETYFLNQNESTYIVAGNKHRLSNPGVVMLIMIEVQTGEYLGEDDIVRFEDEYGRL